MSSTGRAGVVALVVTVLSFLLVPASSLLAGEGEITAKVANQKVTVTLGELLIFVINGVFIACLVSLIAKIGPRDLRTRISVVIGLIGAVAAGILSHLAGLNLGMGYAKVHYADLLCSILGAFVLVGIAWYIFLRRARARARK